VGRRGGATLNPSLELLEREEELAVLASAVEDVTAGIGRVVVLRGAAGIGKTRLLDAAAAYARDRGLLVLRARGTPLEREFAFGVARQLLEPHPGVLDVAVRDDAMSGAASLAAPVVQGAVPVASDPAAADSPFIAMHGLYWTVANLAERFPLLLSIDDVHWADAASLRWLAYVAARLEGIRVLITCAVRPGDDVINEERLQPLFSDAVTRVVDVPPLSASATSVYVRRRLGTAVDDEFRQACYQVSGGNPLILGLLLDALAGEQVASAKRLNEIGVAAVAPHVARRLADLPPSCRQLAEAAAVLGAGAALPDAATVAGVDHLVAADAADQLVRAELLKPEIELTFVHPLLAEAVDANLGDHRRAALHRRAATILGERGAPAERVAAHLLATSPVGDPNAALTLVAAARNARMRGDPEVAVRFLRRAMIEAAAFTERPSAVLELGMLEAALMDPAAETNLRMALDLELTPFERATAAKTLGTLLMMARRGEEAVAVLENVQLEVSAADREADVTLLASLVNLGQYVISTRHRVVTHVKRLQAMDLAGGTPSERSALGVLAMQAAIDGHPVDTVANLARRALDGPRDEIRVDDPSVQCALLGLRAAEEFEEVTVRVGPLLDDAQRRGSPWGAQAGWGIQGAARFDMGQLPQAEADTRAAIALGREHDHTSREPILLATLIAILVDQGRLADADEELAAALLPANWEDSWPALPLHVAIARLRRAQGRRHDALAQLHACAELGARWSPRGIFNIPWRSELALTGEGDESSLRLADEELELATAAGTRSAIGIALRARGLLSAGDERIAILREATAALESSQARLEHARTLIELGAALRRANRRADARAPLLTGIDLAHRSGAAALVERGQVELRATGARPRRLLLTGLEAITASERRVAELAADGMTNREIAQALFVTAKTVEMHLSHIYTKLDITSRVELPAALGRELVPSSGHRYGPNSEHAVGDMAWRQGTLH
jgi:DNA-binding CsgD family transcriptional regulator